MRPHELPRGTIVRYKETGLWAHRRGQIFVIENPCDDGLGNSEQAKCLLYVQGKAIGSPVGVPRSQLEKIGYDSTVVFS